MDSLNGDVSEKVFVVLLSAVVDHGGMKRKGNSDGSRRCGSKHEFYQFRTLADLRFQQM
jgi:hypothetical protein